MSWFIAALVVFCIFWPAVEITDIKSLDGSILQRFAASVTLFFMEPWWRILYSVFPKADGPVYLIWMLLIWGVIGGELAIIVNKLIKKKSNANHTLQAIACSEAGTGSAKA